MKKLKDNINWDNWLIRRKFKPDYIFTNTLKKILDEFEKEKDYKEYNVLEIGCGHGIGTYPLSEIFKHVDAIDPTKKLLDDLDKRIKNDKKTNIKTYLTTCSKFKTKKKYDLIICKWSFIFTNQEKCFKNIMKLLKKNRYLRKKILQVRRLYTLALHKIRLKGEPTAEEKEWVNTFIRSFIDQTTFRKHIHSDQIQDT